jgi:membrane protein
VWGVEVKKGESGIVKTIRKRFMSFTMVLGVGFLLLVSLVLSAGLAAINAYLLNLFPGIGLLLEVGNFIFSFIVITILFAMMYQILPDRDIKWSDVWIGAMFTALLFVVGKFFIGLYLGRSTAVSTYGAAGSLVVVLLWIFYSAQIFLFGAEFTQVYANRLGTHPAVIDDTVKDVPKGRVHHKVPTGTTVFPTGVVPRHNQWVAPLMTIVAASSALVSFVMGMVVGKQENHPKR